MHDMHCNCFHHKFAMVLGLFGAWTTLGFFVSLFMKDLFLGFGSEDYFMSVVVLALAMHGTHLCPCWRKHNEAMCKDCTVDKSAMM
jgi:hypothetical protein